jgi:hypothetical protein
MRRWRAQRRAQGLKPRVLWVAQRDSLPPPEQRLIEARTLALCVMAVEKIRRDPAQLEIVYRNFERWQERDRCVPGASLRAWRKLLRLPWPLIAARLTEQSPQGIELRRTVPLLGILTAWERRRIAAAFRQELIP